MDKTKLPKIANIDDDPQKQEILTQDGRRCKEHLSGIPYWAERANGNDYYWNNLASSHFNIYNDSNNPDKSSYQNHLIDSTRQVITHKELTALFKKEASKSEVYKKIYFHIQRQVPDETGCNWSLNLSNEEAELMIKFAESIKDFNSLLRSKYNLPTE